MSERDLGLPKEITDLAAQYDKQQEDSEKLQDEYKVFLHNVELALRHTPTRQLVNFILDLCGIYDINMGSLEVEAGKREIGLTIKSVLDEIDPLIYVELLTEKMVEETKK